MKPSKRKNGYLVRLFDKDTNALARLRIMDVKISQVSGSLRVWIGTSNVGRDFVLNCDRQSLDLMMKNNKHWFQNALTEDKIREFFRDSFDAHGCVTVRASETHPCKCFVNGRTSSFETTVEKAIGFDATVVIVPAAIYVSASAFSVIWYVEEIHVIDDASEAHETEVDVDRNEIESQWDIEIAAATKMLDDKMAFLMKKYKYIEQLKGQIADLLNIAKGQPIANKSWDEALEKLENKLSGIKTGNLFLDSSALT